MKLNTILFSTDFSRAEDAALEMATALARDSGAKLLILHVLEPPVAYGGDYYYGVHEPTREQVERMLEEVVPPDPAVPYDHRLAMGDPKKAIPDIAAEEGVDLIVMSTHGRSGVLRLLLGSVTEAVVRKAPCPVLTLKEAVAQTTKLQ